LGYRSIGKKKKSVKFEGGGALYLVGGQNSDTQAGEVTTSRR